MRPGRAAEPVDSGSREEGCRPRRGCKQRSSAAAHPRGSGFAATAVRQAPLAGETHSWGQRARGRRRSECPYCLSASWVSANEGLFLHPWKDGGVSLPWRACAPPDGGGFACRTRACPECSPANRKISAGTALEASPSRPTALPQRGKRRDVAGTANPLQARSATLAGKEDV